MSGISKVYYCVDRYGFENETGQWLLASIRSVLENTSLSPVVVYAGWRDDHNTRRIRAAGANVVFGRCRLLPEITEGMLAGKLPPRVEGSLLRYELATLFPDEEWILYVDCDTYFVRTPRINVEDVNTVGAATTPIDSGEAYFNSGVLVFNTPRWVSRCNDFFEFLAGTLGNWLPASVDEAPFNSFFRKSIDELPASLNWRPMFGFTEEADILHFHGAKLDSILCVLQRDFRNFSRDFFVSGHIYELAKHQARTFTSIVPYLTAMKDRGHLDGTDLRARAEALADEQSSSSLVFRAMFANAELGSATLEALSVAYLMDQPGPWSRAVLRHQNNESDFTDVFVRPCRKFGAGKMIVRYDGPGGAGGLSIRPNPSLVVDIIMTEDSAVAYWAGVGLDCHTLICRDGGFPAGCELTVEFVSLSAAAPTLEPRR